MRSCFFLLNYQLNLCCLFIPFIIYQLLYVVMKLVNIDASQTAIHTKHMTLLPPISFI